MTKTWPTLYKKTSAGELQQWRIWVDDNVIHTEYGRVDGKLQTSTDVIKEGKNAGKVNATDAAGQALAEAQSKYDKQLKKRYVLNQEDAAAGKVDTEKVQGGIPPMLSINKSYPKDPILNKLKYPCWIQPKLDGVRCIAVIENGCVTLWSRTQKPITSMPHIVEELEKRFPNRGKLVLDGELYTHTMKDEFQTLMSIVRQEEPDDDGLYRCMEYWVYDMPESSELGFNYQTPYRVRQSGYWKLLTGTAPTGGCKVIALGGNLCNNFADLRCSYDSFLEEGYEGAMAKDLLAPYESGKRSTALLKMKEFSDAEFLVIGMEEGRGKFAGLAAKLVCKMDDGKIFKPSVKCPLKTKKWYWEHQDQVVGKMVTVCYKRLTDDGLPYIPVAKALRESFDT